MSARGASSREVEVRHLEVDETRSARPAHEPAVDPSICAAINDTSSYTT